MIMIDVDPRKVNVLKFEAVRASKEGPIRICMLWFACMCGTHICLPVRMHSKFFKGGYQVQIKS